MISVFLEIDNVARETLVRLWDDTNGGHVALTPAQSRKLAYDLLEAADAAAMAEATGYPFTDSRRINSLGKYFSGPIGSADHLT